MHSEVWNWLMSAVFPTPGAPMMATLCDEPGGAERLRQWSGGSAPAPPTPPPPPPPPPPPDPGDGAKLLDLERLRLNESPRLTTPESSLWLIAVLLWDRVVFVIWNARLVLWSIGLFSLWYECFQLKIIDVSLLWNWKLIDCWKFAFDITKMIWKSKFIYKFTSYS